MKLVSESYKKRMTELAGINSGQSSQLKSVNNKGEWNPGSGNIMKESVSDDEKKLIQNWFPRFKGRYYQTEELAKNDIIHAVNHDNKQFGNLFGNVDSEKVMNVFNFIETNKGFRIEPKIKTYQKRIKKEYTYATDDSLVEKQKQIYTDFHGLEIGRFFSKLQYIKTNDKRLGGTEKPKENQILKLMILIKEEKPLPPILLDYNYAILDGHHRWEAAKRLKIKEIPVIIYRNPSEEQLNEASDPGYLSWKRKNVTLRGVSNPGEENEAGDMLGKGLYTAALSNKSMAKGYGQLYYVLGARPKNPLVFDSLNRWEIWFQSNLLKPYNYIRYKFNENTSIENEVQKLGYDGIEIKGREMVNFKPSDDVKYFKTEQELKNYYDIVVKNSSLNEIRKKIREIILKEVGNLPNDNFNVVNKYNAENNIDMQKPVYYYGTTKTKGDNIRKNGFFDERNISITTDRSTLHNFEDILKVRLKKGAKFTPKSSGLQFDDIKNLVLDYSEKIPLVNTEDILEESDEKQEIDLLKKQVKEYDNWFMNNSMSSKNFSQEKWDDNVLKQDKIRQRLYDLTGDAYGETQEDKKKKNIRPSDKLLNATYNYPSEIPKKVYDYIRKHGNTLTDDASDAVRFSRIINTESDERYPKGDLTIYRAVENGDQIRAGDWVTTIKKYAEEHNRRYFDGKGNILELDVDGRDVLVSPTGNHEEAIYAPFELSKSINESYNNIIRKFIKKIIIENNRTL